MFLSIFLPHVIGTLRIWGNHYCNIKSRACMIAGYEEYTVSFSMDGKQFTDYEVDGKIKVRVNRINSIALKFYKVTHYAAQCCHWLGF